MSTQTITRDSVRTNILVVDDESGIRMVLREFYSREFSVSVVSSADEAGRLLEADRFDIALVDVNMPGMSGKEFFDVCRKQYPEMQFMLMTGKPEFADAINSVKDGAFYYLLKPLDLKLLHSLILNAVQEKKNACGIASYNAGIIKNLGSKYRIVRSLGAGASGVVLLVENKEKLYAMKLLRCNNADNNYSDKMARFMREAEILMRIKNEHGPETPTPPGSSTSTPSTRGRGGTRPSTDNRKTNTDAFRLSFQCLSEYLNRLLIFPVAFFAVLEEYLER